jgi:hypothetical protein
MDSKKMSKKEAAKKQVKTNVGKKIADAKASVPAKKAGAPKKSVSKGANKKAVAGKGNFLFSIPSLHTTDNDYEHLVIAHDMQEACKLLAETRTTEKWPDLTAEQRANRVQMMTMDYGHRNIVQIEPRVEAPIVIQVNHPKPATQAAATLTLQ